MAVTAAEIRAVLTLQDALSPKLAGVMKSIDGVGRAAKAAGDGAAAAAPGFVKMSTAMAAGTVAANALMSAARGIAGMVSGAVSTFGDYEAQMNILRVTTGATEEQMAAMARQARELGADLDLPSTSSAGAARAMVELAKGGLDVANTQKAVKGALQLAAAAGIDEAKAAQLVTGALNAFGLSGDNATKIANQFAYAANASALDATDLAQGFAQAGFMFKAAGLEGEQLISTLIVLGNAGLSGSDGATAAKNAIMQMISPTKDAEKVMNKYGISFHDAKGQMKDMPDIVDMLNARLGKLTQEQRNSALATMLGSDGMKAMIPLMAAGGEKLREYERNLQNTNAASEQSEARSKGVQGALKGLNSQWETLQETVGGKVAPALEGGIRLLADVLGEVNKLAENADFATFGEKAKAGMKDASDGLYSVGQAASEIGDKVKDVPIIGAPLDAFLQTVGSLAVGTAATLRGDAKGAVEAYGEAFRTAGGKIGELATKISETVQPAIDKALEIGAAVKTATDKAGEMGAWQDFVGALQIVADIGASSRDRLGEIADGLGRINDAAGGNGVTMLAGTIKGLALAFDLSTSSAKVAVDGLLSFVAISVNFLGVMANMGRAAVAWARGDVPAMNAAIGDAGKSLGGMIVTASKFGHTLTVEVAEAVDNVAETMGVKTNAAATVTSVNMNIAKNVTDEAARQMARSVAVNASEMGSSMGNGMADVATAADTGMANTVAAIETQAPAAVAAVDAMGDGMVSGIESAAPEMAAAAETAASGAVAAVEGQTGSASAAGSAVGGALGSGMAQGILDWVGRVRAAAAQMVAEAIGGGEVEGEIHSPSERTKETGRMLAAGVAEGIKELAPEVQARMRDLIDAAASYMPVAGEIKRVEGEIAAIRQRGQTDALFRAKEMITIDSEALRLKKEMAVAERSLLPVRQQLALAARDVADIERGSLSERTGLIEQDGKRKEIRLQIIDLERQLIGMDSDSKKAQGIQKQIDKLQDQDRLLGLEAERIQLVNQIDSTAARVRRETLDDQARGQQRVIDLIGDKIAVLGAEQAVFQAREAIIKNALDNEITERERLIAVFRAEAQPIIDRIKAGLAYVDQLEAEGVLTKEQADKLREVGKNLDIATAGTKALGNAAEASAPQIDAATKKAEEMAAAGAKIAGSYDKAVGKVKELGETIGKVSTPFIDQDNPKGRLQRRAGGGPVVPRDLYLVGERGPELFVPDSAGSILPSDATAAMLDGSSGGSTGRGGGGGATREIHLHMEGAQIYGMSDFESAVQRAVGRGLKRGQFGG